MKTFIATAPAAYRPMIGAAIAIALADAGRDVARRADGRPTTVPESLLDADAGVDDRILVLVLPYPNGQAQDLFQGIEDAVLAGHYDPAGASPGMKAAVAAFRQAIAEQSPTYRPYDTIAGRRIVSSSIETVETGLSDNHGRPIMTQQPVVFCDDGSAFRLNTDGEWRKLRPVPTTPAGIEWKARVDARAAEPDDMEE